MWEEMWWCILKVVLHSLFCQNSRACDEESDESDAPWCRCWSNTAIQKVIGELKIPVIHWGLLRQSLLVQCIPQGRLNLENSQASITASYEAKGVFWESKKTRLPCSYLLILDYSLSASTKDWILGQPACGLIKYINLYERPYLKLCFLVTCNTYFWMDW